MDRPHHWPQEVVIKPMEEILIPTTNSSINNLSKASSSSFERRVVKPAAQKAVAAVNCPRCDSRNTKFCYYNNYSLSQPRYFCKSCRRYWTEGGTLRNIPVGGGSRKNNKIRFRSSSSSSSTTSNSSSYNYNNNNNSSKKLIPGDLSTGAIVISENPPAPLTSARIHHDEYYGKDLNLGFPSSAKINVYNNVHGALALLPHFDATNSCASTTSCSSTSTTSQLSALELLTGITTTTTTTRGSMNSFMPIPVPDPNSVYSSASTGQLMIPMSEFKFPSLGFSLDENHGMGSTTAGGSGPAYNNLHDQSNSCGSGRPPFMFPSFEDHDQLKKLTNTPETHDHPYVEQNKDDDSNGFWNGMMGTDGSWCD